jgi:hypothetical protein
MFIMRVVRTLLFVMQFCICILLGISVAYATPDQVRFEITGLGIDDGDPESPFNLPLGTTLVPGKDYKLLVRARNSFQNLPAPLVNIMVFNISITNGTLKPIRNPFPELDSCNLPNPPDPVCCGTNIPESCKNPFWWKVGSDISHIDGRPYDNQKPGQFSAGWLNGKHISNLELAHIYFTAGPAGSTLEINLNSNPWAEGSDFANHSLYTIEDKIFNINGGQGLLYQGSIAAGQSDENCGLGGQDCIYNALLPIACAGANGFLEQINIASVINLQQEPLVATITYRDLLGVTQGRVTAIIPSKQDFIINDMGLKPDTYGTVCIETNASLNGAWKGGIALYKPNYRYNQGGLDFALYYPFTNPSYGQNTIPLNTFHFGVPANATVANWISIIDAVPGNGKGIQGELRYYNDAGDLIYVDIVDISDGGRMDYAGHIALAGLENRDAVGMARFVPISDSLNFYLTVARYFYDPTTGGINDFYTAFVVPNRPPTMLSKSGIISTNNGEYSIIEFNNSGVSTSQTLVTANNSFGTPVGTTLVSVPPLSTRHVIVNRHEASGFLDSDSLGGATVTPQSASISAISLFYKLDDFGRLLYAYAAPFVGIGSQNQMSEFNTFIDHTNRMEIFNSTSSSITSSIDVLNYDGSLLLKHSTTLLPRASARLSFDLPKDTYGSILIENSKPGLVIRNTVSREGEYRLSFPAH